MVKVHSVLQYHSSDLLRKKWIPNSRVALYCMYARDCGFKVVRVRSPGIDIFFILLHYENHLHAGDINSVSNKKGRTEEVHKRLWIQWLSESLTPVTWSALGLLGLKVLSGAIAPVHFKERAKSKRSNCCWRRRNSWRLSPCLGIRFRGLFLNEIRYLTLRCKCEVREVSKNSSYFDLSSLPPYLSVLIQNLRHVNYQVAILKRGHVAEPSLLRL